MNGGGLVKEINMEEKERVSEEMWEEENKMKANVVIGSVFKGSLQVLQLRQGQ